MRVCRHSISDSFLEEGSVLCPCLPFSVAFVINRVHWRPHVLVCGNLSTPFMLHVPHLHRDSMVCLVSLLLSGSFGCFQTLLPFYFLLFVCCPSV